ncbi:MAG: response regulator, partial [Microcoleus sp. CAN_BIN18]|nr:response regulator [Microcoleus sp. CAN_BIN18]
RSEVGRGTTFAFDIPVSAVDAANIQPVQPSRRAIALEANQPRYRILIVDDREDNRKLLIKLLAAFDFELQEASNGAEAIEIWSSFEPHLIFMDMWMPVMDGHEATKQIKATVKGEATAIIAVSAANAEEARTVTVSDDSDDFIHKPFRDTEIFATLHKHLGVRYIYDEPENVPEPNKIEAPTSETIAALPADWLAALEKATIECDLELILSQIELIRDRNHSLASALTALANDFQFNQILALIRPATK